MQKSEFWIDAAQAGGRIDVVVSELSGLTRSQVQKLIEHGHLTVNSSAMKPNYKAPAFCNAQMNTRETREHCRLDREGSRLLEAAMRALGLSARGFSKVLKVARTVADLAGEQAVGAPHVAEALQYRSTDRR